MEDHSDRRSPSLDVDYPFAIPNVGSVHTKLLRLAIRVGRKRTYVANERSNDWNVIDEVTVLIFVFGIITLGIMLLLSEC